RFGGSVLFDPGGIGVDDHDVAAGVPPELTAGAALHQRGQPAVGGGAHHDRPGADGVGVFRDHPSGGAVVRGVQQDLALAGDVVRGEPVQVAPDHRTGGIQALAIDRLVAHGRALLCVHHVNHATADDGQPG